MKIWLQFTWIEEYLIGFFLGVRSAFNGRIRSNQVMICDQSRLDWIAIESRTWGDHKELKILLQNRLISSRFNQELRIHKKNIDIYKGFPRKKCRPFDSVKTDRWSQSRADRGPRSHDCTTQTHALR